MSGWTQAELWDRLKSAGVVRGELPPSPAAPWYVRVMLGVAGWIGALFFLGFIGAVFAAVLKTSGAAAIAAVLCCCGTYAVFALAPKNDLGNQFGLATGIAGQILFAVALSHVFHAGDAGGFFLFAVTETALTMVIPNFTHRIFTTLGAVAAFSLGCAEAGLHEFAVPLTGAACAYVWRREMQLPGPAALWQAVGYGLALGVLQTTATAALQTDLLHLLHRGGGEWLQRHGAEVGTGLVSVVCLWVAVDILRGVGIIPSSTEGRAILCCAMLLLAVSFPAHGLAPSLLLVILGFAGGNRVLLGLGLCAMGGFLSHYYYQMHETLLLKSMMLAATGTFLLVTRWLLVKLFPATGEGHRA